MKTMIISVILLMLAIAGNTQTGDVPPYKFAETPEGVKLYKTVHQGCEIFLAVGTQGYYGQQSPAIALGRGCK
jgi:hypothetical protein